MAYDILPHDAQRTDCLSIVVLSLQSVRRGLECDGLRQAYGANAGGGEEPLPDARLLISGGRLAQQAGSMLPNVPRMPQNVP
jgi:hypothetical protein